LGNWTYNVIDFVRKQQYVYQIAAKSVPVGGGYDTRVSLWDYDMGCNVVHHRERLWRTNNTFLQVPCGTKFQKPQTLHSELTTKEKAKNQRFRIYLILYQVLDLLSFDEII
jgi:hypothetical protein